ncbi:hypothetical protein JCM11251_001134 [Rhodosporidiobolus azoricus]
MPLSTPPPSEPVSSQATDSSPDLSTASPSTTTPTVKTQETIEAVRRLSTDFPIRSNASARPDDDDEPSGGTSDVAERSVAEAVGAEQAGVSMQTREDKGKGTASGEEEAKETALDRFSCHICLDLPSQPVVTPCGHMYCWPCMHEWLVVAKGRACPLCKTQINVDQLIPVYSAAGESDPRDTPLPPRPRPAPSTAASSFRSPASRASSFFGPFAASPGFTFQAGVFPLPGFSATYAWPPGPPVDEEEERERMGLATGVMGNPHGGGRVAPEQEWLRGVMQQAFMLLFFAVFVALTFSG